MAYVTRGIGGKGLVVINGGYRYHRHATRTEKIAWRCFRPDCRALLKTNIFDLEDPDAVVRVLKVWCMYTVWCFFFV